MKIQIQVFYQFPWPNRSKTKKVKFAGIKIKYGTIYFMYITVAAEIKKTEAKLLKT